MNEIPISHFKGIAPRFGDDVAPGYAATAENCLLDSGKIKPRYRDLVEETLSDQYNSLVYYNGKWLYSNDAYYVKWKLDSVDLLIHLVNGVPYKTIGDATVPLGQTRPEAPTVALNGAGNVADTCTYFITTTRNVGGSIDESGPSALSDEIVAASNKVTVTAPTIDDEHVTHWNIYRIGNLTGAYQLVAQVDVDEATYDDDLANASLGASPPVWYTSYAQSNAGIDIIFDKPQVTFDGLATDIYSGMLFAWKDSTLYWPEPGNPDAWPSVYNENFPSRIKRAIPLAGFVSVLTQDGPKRFDGEHPELLRQSEMLGEEPCVGTAACKTSRGVAYLSDSGITLFDGIGTRVISDAAIGEDLFAGHVRETDFDRPQPAGSILLENDNILYYFNSSETLVCDMRDEEYMWYSIADVAIAAWKMESGSIGYISYGDQDRATVDEDTGTATIEIKKLDGNRAHYKVWEWESGNLLGDHPKSDKMWGDVEINGTGTIELVLLVDGEDVATKTLDFSTGMDRDRILAFPEHTYGRAAKIKMTGSTYTDSDGEAEIATVQEALVRYSL